MNLSLAGILYISACVAVALATFIVDSMGNSPMDAIEQFQYQSATGTLHVLSWYLLLPPTLLGPWIVYRRGRVMGPARFFSWGAMWVAEGVGAWLQVASYLAASAIFRANNGGPLVASTALLVVLCPVYLVTTGALIVSTPIALAGLTLVCAARRRAQSTWERFCAVDAMSLILGVTLAVRYCVTIALFARDPGRFIMPLPI
jgi:hypothetical protein